MKFRISPLTAVLFAAAYFSHSLRQISAAYAVITLHELAHLAAALCIGMKPESFSLSPFGAHLTLANRIVRSAADEIILYAAGPLCNAILALVSLALGMKELYRINTALMIMNILPVIPLDGGIILKKALTVRLGGIAAGRVMAAVSFMIALAAAAAAAMGIYKGILNLSAAGMCLFLFGNILMSKEKYNTDFIASVAGSKKYSNRTRFVVAQSSEELLNAAQGFSASHSTFAVIPDNDGNMREVIGEREILRRLSLNLNQGVDFSV